MIPLRKAYRMSLISAGSISLDSTFKTTQCFLFTNLETYRIALNFPKKNPIHPREIMKGSVAAYLCPSWTDTTRLSRQFTRWGVIVYMCNQQAIHQVRP